MVRPTIAGDTMKQSIGVLDSGIGGLSVVREINALLPAEDIVYFGDSAWCPYGVRSAEEIQERVFAIADLLLARGCKALVIACNSATIAAVEGLRASYPVPIIGMEPGVRPAVAMTKSGVVGVFATEASIRGEKFHRLLNSHAHSVKVITRPCPEFVDLIERGVTSGEEAEAVVRRHVDPMLAAEADVLVLGCTHYPFLAPLIEMIAGGGVSLVDTGTAVARQLGRVLDKEGLLCGDAGEGELHILTSGDPAHYRAVIARLPRVRAPQSVVASGQTV